MRHPRIYTQQPLAPGAELCLNSGASQHLVQVLRHKPKDTLILFNGDGHEYFASIKQLTKTTVTVNIYHASEVEPEAALQIDLGLSVSRGERMDWAIQKAVELGVTTLTPLNSERTQVKFTSERLAKRMQHWQGIVIAACEQSGRRRLPILHSRTTLDAWLGRQHPELNLLLDPEASIYLVDLPPPQKHVSLLIGPEGGLSEAEKKTAVRAGFTAARLGPRILRTETAPLAALAVIQGLWGDFRHNKKRS